ASGVPDAGGDLTLAEVERLHILRMLDRHQWNKTRTAAALGIDVKTLYSKLRSYGVPSSRRRDPEP
ncbi:MAG: helix-turn-helix domain-containing protein, partial [Candidatus Rokuibacteriota bacterium]